jgi:hypothetical protein
MYTTLRLYRCDPSDVLRVRSSVDEIFADRLAEIDGFVAYELVDCGNGRLFTVTVFSDRDRAEQSNELSAQFIRESLPDVSLERTDVLTGEVAVNRAKSDMLEMVHA